MPTHVTTGTSVLDPALLGRISDLELVARIVVEGLISGLHRSPFHGYSAEFNQYRHYRPGDDLKYVDWKLVARTDRLYTKQFRETTNMSSAIVIDTSGSMNFPVGGAASKLRYGIVASAALAHLIAMQGDAVALVTADTFLAPRSGRQQLRRVLATLAGLRAGATWNAADIIRRAAERLGRRGLLIVVSDFYDQEEQAFSELRRAARLGHEIVLFQVMSREEVEFVHARDVEFVDMESDRTVSVDAMQARREYLDAVAAFLERWRLRAGSEGFQYSLMVTDVPLERALRNFLLARQRR